MCEQHPGLVLSYSLFAFRPRILPVSRPQQPASDSFLKSQFTFDIATFLLHFVTTVGVFGLDCALQ